MATVWVFAELDSRRPHPRRSSCYEGAVVGRRRRGRRARARGDGRSRRTRRARRADGVRERRRRLRRVPGSPGGARAPRARAAARARTSSCSPRHTAHATSPDGSRRIPDRRSWATRSTCTASTGHARRSPEARCSSTSHSKGPAPHLVLVRPKSFAAEPSGGTADRGPRRRRDPRRRSARMRSDRAPRGGASGPKLEEAKVVISGGRGLQEAGNFRLLDELAGAIGERRRRCEPRGRRRRMGAVQLPGRADREDREARRLHRRRDQRGAAARRRHEGFETDRRDQQGSRRADLPPRRSRRRRATRSSSSPR